MIVLHEHILQTRRQHNVSGWKLHHTKHLPSWHKLFKDWYQGRHKTKCNSRRVRITVWTMLNPGLVVIKQAVVLTPPKKKHSGYKAANLELMMMMIDAHILYQWQNMNTWYVIRVHMRWQIWRVNNVQYSLLDYNTTWVMSLKMNMWKSNYDLYESKQTYPHKHITARQNSASV